MIDQDTLHAYGNAASALGRLEERLSLSPVADALSARLRAAELEAIAWVEGDILDVDDMEIKHGRGSRQVRRWPHRFAAAFGRPLPTGRPPSPSALIDWLGVAEGGDVQPSDPLWDHVEWRSRPEILERAEAWARAVEPALEMPRLVAGAEFALAWMRVSPLPRSNASAAVLLGDRWSLARANLGAGGMAAIGLRARNTYWAVVAGPSRPRERALWHWLQALIAAARFGLELDDRLRLYRARCATHLAQRWSNGRFAALIELALVENSVTLALASRKLGISKQAANVLIGQGLQAGVLRERTGQRSYRRFCAAV